MDGDDKAWFERVGFASGSRFVHGGHRLVGTNDVCAWESPHDVNVFDRPHMFQCVHPMNVRLYALPKPYVRQFQVPIHDVQPIMTT